MVLNLALERCFSTFILHFRDKKTEKMNLCFNFFFLCFSRTNLDFVKMNLDFRNLKQRNKKHKAKKERPIFLVALSFISVPQFND